MQLNRTRTVRTGLRFVLGALLAGAGASNSSLAAGGQLQPATFRHYVEEFNAQDQELYVQQIPNTAAWSFLSTNIPLFECPDPTLERTYYFRWWTFRKHLRLTPDGYIITEFLPPVPWAGKHNSINCPAGHHFYEGRWLRDPRYLDDYGVFWFRKGGDPRRYSFWAADALQARSRVTGDKAQVIELLPDLVRNYEEWEKKRRDPNGLFWQDDGQDGMEVSLGGSGYRATINSYMFGDATALAALATQAGQPALAARFGEKAAVLQRLVQEQLWDADAQFFKVAPRPGGGPGTSRLHLAGVRELHGYTPWYFNLPEPACAVAWKQLMDAKGFFAPFGPTTAEQRHPGFAVAYQGHECQWNGPSWPYATAITLTALANLLNGQPQGFISRADYLALLQIYARSHQLKRGDGRTVCWIDENLNPFTGDWIARTLLQQRKQQPAERGKDYNHSTFCDLVISGLVGLRPRADQVLEVNPLVPAETWDWFCLDAVTYHGKLLTILWDKSGTRYGRGQGLRVLANGREIASAPTLGRLTATLPDTTDR
jgi:hypothetical protein